MLEVHKKTSVYVTNKSLILYGIPIKKKKNIYMTFDGTFLCWQIHFLIQRHFENPIWFGS